MSSIGASMSKKVAIVVSSAPYAKSQRVVINIVEAGPFFHGAAGEVKAVKYKAYKGQKKKAGWWVTVDADPPPGIKRARIVLHADGLLPQDIYDHRKRHQKATAS